MKFGFFRSILVAAGVFSCLFCVAAVSATLPPPPSGEGMKLAAVTRTVTNSVPDRIYYDCHGKFDLRVASGIEFDFHCADLSAFTSFSVYFKSGDGWYVTNFAPERQGTWERIVISRRTVNHTEGTVRGWGEITCVRISAWRGSAERVETGVANLAVIGSKPHAAVICADSCGKSHPKEKNGFIRYAVAVADAFDTIGYPATVISDLDLTAEMLAGVELVVLPYNPEVPATAADAIRSFRKNGGKLFVLYSLPKEVREMLGLKYSGFCRPEKEYGRNFAGLVRTQSPLAGQPQFAPQRSWAATRLELTPGVKVLAQWSTGPNEPARDAALVETEAGIFLGHVWLGNSEASWQLLRAITEELVPASSSVFAEADARRQVRERKQLEYIRSLPPVANEFRAAWCHSAWGLGGMHDWDSSIRFLRDHGFTDIIANLAWGGMAFYKSEVLPVSPECVARGDAFDQALAACRKYGVKLNVWKVCWRLNSTCTKEYRAAMKAAGRMQVTFEGKDDLEWFCPSHPENLKAEIAAMVELAKKGADGVHFDYIRYPSRNGCFCDRCRRLFERQLGAEVANWPADVRKNPELEKKWNAFRAANITAAVKGVADQVHGRYPAKISAAVFRDAPRDACNVGQDWGRWCREGWLDFVCPMDYTPSTALHNAVVRRQLPFAGKAAFYPGIGLSCWPLDGCDSLRLAEQIAGLRALGVKGFTVFNFDSRAEAAFPALREGPLRVAAEWIAGSYEPPVEMNTAAFFVPARNSIVKKSFRTKGAVKTAVWRVAAPGMRDLFVNGVRVSATALPPWTPYRERVLEEEFDVTAFVKAPAENELAVELGNGWFNPLPLTMWYRYNLREALAIGTPSVRATLTLDYADGSREEIATDSSWRAFDGRVIHNSLYLGVVEDQRLEMTSTGSARVVKGPAGRVCPAGGFPKTTVIGRRSAKSVKALPGGAYLVDFGVNATGTLKVRLRNVKDGQRVSFRQGERVFEDGTVNTLTATAGQIKDPKKGPLFAVAEPCDTVICRAAAETVFEPRLTFHVFRYVQVEGLAEAPKAEDFEALDWSADVKESTAFACSDARLNELHAVCRRTFRANLQSVQSDCPGREKFGYDGDVSCTAESFCLNWDMHEFYKKAIRDYLDEAAGDGLFTETAPFVGIASNAAVPGKGSRAAPIGWATGVPVLIDTVLRYYGDFDIVREAYPALVRYLAILEQRFPANDIPKCLGDWVPVPGEKANEELSGIAHYYQFLRLTEKFARLLNHPQDAARLARRADSVAKTWRGKFLKENGLVGRGVQGEQLFGLYHGLVPEADRAAALDILKKNIAAHDNALTVGIFGIQYLFEYLSANGEAALAGKVLTHRGYPGYYHMIDRGATTLWESWSEQDSLNRYSNCHPMYGGFDQWLVRYLLGIAVTENAVGCDKVRIRPNAVCGVTWAKGHLDTPRGRISVSWQLKDGRMTVEKRLPPGIVEM